MHFLADLAAHTLSNFNRATYIGLAGRQTGYGDKRLSE